MLFSSLVGYSSYADSNRVLTYQGRILKPDGSPLENNTNFKFIVRSSDNCILWTESQIINMAGSNGALSVQIGSATNESSGTHSFSDVFQSGKVLNGLAGCDIGTSYSGTAGDNRKIQVSFNDGGGLQVMPSIALNSVPFALQSDFAQSASGLNGISLSSIAPTGGQVLQYNSGTSKWEPANAVGSGTVTNVDLIGSSIFSVSGGPVTGSGSFNLSLASQASGNFILASPNGVGGIPTFRAIVVNDIPVLPAGKITSGTLSAAVGGTGLVPAAGNANQVIGLNAAGTNTEYKQILAGSGVIVNTGTAGQIVISSSGGGTGTVTQVNTGAGLSGGPFTTAGTITLASSGIAAGTYGSISSYVPWFNFDTFGRATSAGSLQISINANQITAGTLNSAQIGTVPLASLLAQTSNIANTLVLRDGIGGFAAGQVTALGLTLQGSGTVGISTPLTANYSLILPANIGTPGQVLTTNGTNNLAWTTVATGGTSQWTSVASGIHFSTGSVGIGTTTPTGRLTVAGGDASINGLTIGLGAGAINTNTVVGSNALTGNTSGGYNTAIGYYTLSSNSTGGENSALGRAALNANTTGGLNTAVGANALLSNTTGNNGTALGAAALYNNTTGDSNTAVGERSLLGNTTGSYNTATGNHSLLSNSTGSSNAAYGIQALNDNTTGSNNTAVGRDALYRNTTADNNTSIGESSLLYNTTGANNSALGNSALRNQTTGANNSALGYQAGADLTTGSNNIFLGQFGTGFGITTGSNNIMLGADVRPVSQTASNQLNIGNLIYANSLGSGALAGSGSLGIGTSSPAARLDIAGGVRIANDVDSCAPGKAGTIRYASSSIQFCNGTSWGTLGVAGAGITNLNGMTGGAQTFGAITYVGTAGTISSASDVHTLNIPLATTAAAVAGLISNVDYQRFNNKLSTTLGTGSIWIGQAGVATQVAVTGDASLTSFGTLTLANSGVSAGTYPRVTVDAKGRVTSAGTLNISDIPSIDYLLPAQAGNAGKVLSSNGTISSWATPAASGVTNLAAGAGLSGGTISSTGTISLSTTTVTAGSFGSSSFVPTFIVDAYGRLTGAGSVAIAAVSDLSSIAGTLGVAKGGTGLNSATAANGQLLVGNGSGFTLGTLNFSTGIVVSNTAGTINIGTNAQTTNAVNTLVMRDLTGSFAAGTATLQGLTLQGLGTVGISTPLTANYSMILPTNIGSSGQVLTTNGTSSTTWTSMVSSQWTNVTNGVNFASGSVGIGTASPAKNLDIQAPGSDSSIMRLSAAGNASYYTDFINNVNASNSFEIQNHGFTILKTSADGFGAITLGNTNSTLVISPQNTNAYFTAPVGFGTTSIGLGNRLEVYGGAIAAGPRGAAAGDGGELRLKELLANGTNTVAFRAPDSISQNVTMTLPGTIGAAGQVLSTDGTGTLSWITAGGGSGDFMKDGSVPMTGVLRGTFGSAAAPSFSFSGDTGTGIFRAGTGSIGVSTGGIERLRIDSSGNVGIGTTSPTTKLVIEGGEIAGGVFTGTAPGIVRVGGGAYNANDIVSMDFGLNNLGSGTAPLARIGAEITGGGSYFRFGTSNNYNSGVTNTAMSIDPNGNVGIGTTSPGSLFDVEQTRADTAAGTQQLIYQLLTVNPASASATSFDNAYIRTNISGSQNITGSVQGVQNYVINNNSGTIAALSATNYTASNNSSGAVTTLYGVNSWADNTSTGAVGSSYGGFFETSQGSSGQISNAYGVATRTRNSSTSTMPSGYGLYGYVWNSSSGTITSAFANSNLVDNTSTGTVTNAYGSKNKINNSGGGAVSTAYGITSELVNSSGAVTNWYGLYIPSVTGTAPTTARFPIYVVDTGSNYFAGNVGIGTTSPNSKLTISGADSAANGIGASLQIQNTAAGGDSWYIRSGATGNSWGAGNLNLGNSVVSGMTLQGSTGNVGIGTDSPATKLEVAGTVTASAFVGNGAGLTGVTGTDTTKVAKSGDTMTGVLNLPANGLVLGTNQLVASSGSVGIGTASPAAQLHLANSTKGGDLGISQQGEPTPYMRLGMDSGYSQYIANNAYWTGTAYNFVNTVGYGGLASRISQVSGKISLDTASGGVNPISWDPRLTILNSGNVGIGTAVPTEKLEVNGNVNISTGNLLLGGNVAIDANSGWHRSYGVTGWYNGTYAGGIYMNDATYIRTYGSKGFYVAAPTAVTPGITSFGGPTSYGIHGQPTTAGYGGVIGYTQDGLKYGILGHGNTYSFIGAGALSNNGNMSITGDATITGNTTSAGYFFSSDKRLKTDIKPIKSGLDIINQLRGVYFNWKDSGKPDMGFIAQEIEQILPDMVSTNPNTGLKAVKYGNLTAPLVEATKELYGMCKANTEDIEVLKRSIASLEDENKDLKQRMAKIEKAIQMMLEKKK